METINDIVRELRSEPLAENGAKPWLHYLADRIEAAYNREMAHNESLQQKAGETVVGLMHKMNAQSSEIAELRECLRLSSNSMEIVVQWLGRHPAWQECLKNGVARNRKVLKGVEE